MTMHLLRQIAGSRLPVSFHRAEDIAQVKALRAAGFVIALVPAPADPLSPGPADAAQVLALTQEGRQELAGTTLQAPQSVRDWRRTPRRPPHAWGWPGRGAQSSASPAP